MEPEVSIVFATPPLEPRTVQMMEPLSLGLIPALRAMVLSSAWERVFLSVFLRLYPLAMTLPSFTMTQPMGTSP